MQCIIKNEKAHQQEAEDANCAKKKMDKEEEKLDQSRAEFTFYLHQV